MRVHIIILNYVYACSCRVAYLTRSTYCIFGTHSVQLYDSFFAKEVYTVYSIHICMHLFTLIILYTVYSINTNYYIFQLLREQTEVAHPPLDSSSLWLDRKGLSFEPGAPSDCCERGPATKGGVLSQVRKESIQWRLQD